MPENLQGNEPAPPLPEFGHFTCPKCGTTLRAELPDVDVLIVCPRCWNEFSPSSAEPSTPGAIKQIPRRKGALKPESGPSAEPQEKAAETAPTSPSEPLPPDGEPIAEKRAPRKKVDLPPGELLEQESEPSTARKHRTGSQWGIRKIVILALLLVGGSVLAWTIMFSAQKQQRGKTATNTPATTEPRPPESRITAATSPKELANDTAPKPVAKVEAPRKDLPPVEPGTPSRETRRREAFAAAEAAAQALSAATWQELLGRVRAPEAVEPLMRQYYAQNGPFHPERPTEILAANLASVESGSLLAFISLQMPDFQEKRVVLEKKPGGVYLVDWESLVSYQQMPWEAFVKQKPAEPLEFRVGVELLREAPSQVTPLPGVLEPADAYFTFGVRPGVHGETTPAYMRKTAESSPELYALLQNGQRFDVILKLRYTEVEGLGQILEIVELIQYGWLKGYGEAPPQRAPAKLESEPL